MRLVSTKSIKPGTALGRTIYNENGHTLVQHGIGLTERMINRLVQQGITYVYIEDEITGDIQIKSAISDEVRLEAVQTIKSTFNEMNKDGFMKSSYILNKQEKSLTEVVQRIMEELQNHEESISLLADIFVTDDYIFQHSLNVTIYALAIGKELNLPNKELSEIGFGAMLHDIGKTFIDPKILQKRGKLSEEEFEVIKDHTKLGFDFLRKHQEISTVVAHCAYQHHERIDGSGYPRGIVDEEIHKYAKLIGIADVFDAVTSNRIYRDAMLPHEGLEILYAGAVQLFDRTMVEAFKKSVAVYPNGLSVELSDGKIGVVMKQNKHLCDRPVIRITKEASKQVSIPYEVDLASAVNVTITACNVA